MGAKDLYKLFISNHVGAVQAYREGRMTIRQCADMLGVDYFEMNEILKSENINIMPEPEQGLATLLPELEDSFGKNP
ncbi:UPF0175 family protein [Desulfofundulus salinus]|uniref:UPF0175 family protein n=1 Tax=Desulfofundulus salinus TaxID=2419843 RepID=UPI00242D22FA|nr:UPF0175 family protein [Desulfofundulus salinum]